MTFAIGLEACRFLEDVLMPSTGQCHYQIKYFRAPLVTSSARHVHKTTRRPPEDQFSWRFQMHLKHEDVLKTTSCFPQGYVTIKLNILKPNWWRLQHVMFIWPQEDHPKTSPHMTFTSGPEAWICLEDVLTRWSLLCDYEIKYFKGPLVTSSTRHVHKTKKYHPKTSPHDVCKWTWSMNVSWRCPDAFFTVMIKLSNKICKALYLGYVFNTSYLCKKTKLVAIINRPRWVFRVVWQFITRQDPLCQSALVKRTLYFLLSRACFIKHEHE